MIELNTVNIFLAFLFVFGGGALTIFLIHNFRGTLIFISAIAASVAIALGINAIL